MNAKYASVKILACGWQKLFVLKEKNLAYVQFRIPLDTANQMEIASFLKTKSVRK